jgi:Ser/Thr protein kinase RdoA (MazF antagonist)
VAGNWLVAHLASTYGIDIMSIDRLDEQVWRVQRRDGADWVARVFEGLAAAEVSGQLDILNALERVDFPAERGATSDPISLVDDTAVLVTTWVDGHRAEGDGRTYAYLGGLLGALHSRDGGQFRTGGAWHHLSATGGPRAEIDAALNLLSDAEPTIRPEQGPAFDQILGALHDLDDCADTPQALIHPDAVPSNAIRTAEDTRVIIDWSGAGRGPRLWSVAFTLWAAGARSPKLVDAVLSRYHRRVRLTPDELGRLVNVIPARPLTMDVWGFAHQGLGLDQVLRRWNQNRRLAERIAGRVQLLAEEVTTRPPGDPSDE